MVRKGMETIQLMPGCKMLLTKTAGNIMFGCPSEVMKTIVKEKVALPECIVLPDDFFKHRLVQASPMFMRHLAFKVFKGYRTGKSLRVLGTEQQIRKIRQVLDLFMFGPGKKDYKDWGIPQKQTRIFRAMGQYFTPYSKCRDIKSSGDASTVESDNGSNNKPAERQRSRMDDLVEFITYKDDKAKLDKVIIKHSGKNLFTVKEEGAECEIDIDFNTPQEPPIAIRVPVEPITRSVLGATSLSECAGESCPVDYGPGIVIWVNGLGLAIDGLAWMEQHLANSGIQEGDIAGYVLTHIHCDLSHLFCRIEKKEKFTLITAKVIFRSFIRLASLYLSLKEETIQKYVEFREASIRKEMDWYGSRIIFWYTAHTIPSIGFRICVNDKCIVFSGDTAWGSRLSMMLYDKCITKAFYRQVQNIPGLVSELTFIDSGSGSIHARPHELAELPEQVKKHLVLMQADDLPGKLAGQFQLPETGKHWEIIPQSRKEVSELISIEHAPFLKKLSTQWYAVLLSQSRSRIFSRGEIMLNRNSPSENYYLILSGVISLSIGRHEIIRLTQGDFFSDSIIGSTSVSDARSLVVSPVRTLEISKSVFAELVGVAKLEKEFYYDYEARPTLVNLAVMDKMPLKGMRTITDFLDMIEYKAGDTIIAKGDKANSFFGILKGEAEIMMGSGHDVRKILSMYPRYIARERVFRHSGKHASNVIAKKDTKVFYINTNVLKSLMSIIPNVFFEFGVVSKKPR